MSFVSVAFFVLFALTLAAQWLLPSRRLRQLALLAASYVFYGWWDWRFCFLMLFLTAVAFFTGLRLEKKPGSRPALALGVMVPLAVLFFFKYMGFFVDSFCALFGLNPACALRILLPVGISFYTFQSLSYTIDAYRGKVAISHDFCKFALYIAFFPQLVAGPIVKAADFLPQLEEDRRPTGAGVAQGMNLFLWGMLKKAVFADQISPFVDSVFATPAAFSSGTVALAVLAYAIQIYFDFSGYSDMAIGCAICLGYDLMKNFDLPYLSRNVSEFWKRWHISLSTWLMEYLYIPLGGNRKGRARTYLNLMITMLLGGLWHGAGINFILWGGFHGLALCAHKAWARKFSGQTLLFPHCRRYAVHLCVRLPLLDSLPRPDLQPDPGRAAEAVLLVRRRGFSPYLVHCRYRAAGSGDPLLRLPQPGRSGPGAWRCARIPPGQLLGHLRLRAAGGVRAGVDVHRG